MADYFTFNGVSSKTHGLKCKEISHISFASKNYESIKIPGRTGNLIIDDGSYENKSIPIIAYLDLRKTVDKKTALINIQKWLVGHTGYKNLVFDDGIGYKAIVDGEVDFKEKFRNYYEIHIKFECGEVI